MLSNKLTFSLVYLLMFAALLVFISMPVVAQRVVELPSTSATDFYNIGSTEVDPANASNFLVIRDSINNGILDTASDPDRPLSTAAALTNLPENNVFVEDDFPDLEDFFEKGGTIDVVTPITGRYEQADDRWHEVVVTEIMWALDWRPVAETARIFEPNADKQWIELYNNTGFNGDGEAYKGVDGRGEDHVVRAINNVRLLLTNNIFLGAKAAESPPTEAKYVGVYGTTYAWLNARPAWVDTAASVGGAATGGTAEAFVRADDDTMTYERVYKVLDRVSNMGRGGRQGPLPGQSGSSARTGGDTPGDVGTLVDGEYTPLISAFRKRVLLLDDNTGVGTYHPAHQFAKGSETGGWMSSWEGENAVRRVNIDQAYIATPGAEHLTPKPPEKTVVGEGVVFNEIRNDTSEDDLDWIELYNNSDAAVDIGPYRIGLVATADYIDDVGGIKKIDFEAIIIDIPDSDDDGQKIMLQPDEYLVIVNRDPEDSILADGKDITINASNRLKLEGATHLYYFPRLEWELPNDFDFDLVLRTGGDPGKQDGIADFVGSVFITDLRDDVDTKVWPLRNWTAPEIGTADDKAAEFKNFGSQGRTSVTWARKNYRADHWWRNDEWSTVGYAGGIGYRKDLGHGLHLEAPGTPGYNNQTGVTYSDFTKLDAGGAVTISEIMYDAGAAWDLVQWIEIYNNSMTESVDISGWTMDIRNARDDEEPDRSFVDADFEFDPNTIIAPNQTLLVVSATGATNVPANRVYDLYDRHGNDLGLKSRRAYLLSKVGFRIELYDDAITPVLVDAAGNAYLDGASVITGEANPDDADDGGWALHEVSGEGEARHSMVRQYGARFGTKAETSGYESAAPGTMDGAWRKAGLESGNIGIFYGHTDDFSTPAFRRGGPLPVSLSSFRPYRDKATGEVVVRWVTESELNNAGFNILRSEAKSGEFKVINLKGLIQGHGTTSEKHVYTFIDKTAKPNVVYYYQIEDVSMDGQRTTLTTTHLRGNVTAANKLTIRWGELKSSDK